MKEIIIMVAGLPGTGKSTFARALAEAIGATHLNDADYAAKPTGKKKKGVKPPGKKTYEDLLDQAGQTLDQGRNLVISGLFYKESYRMKFIRLAGAKNADIRWIELHAGKAVAEKRVREGQASGRGGVELYRKVKDLYEPMDRSHLVLWSDQLSREEMILRTLDFLSLPS